MRIQDIINKQWFVCVVIYIFDLQAKDRRFNSPLLRSFPWEYKPRSRHHYTAEITTHSLHNKQPEP